MKTLDADEVVTRDKSSGRIHRRVLTDGGKLLSFEGCNLDDAGAYEVLTFEEAAHAIATAKPGELCRNDFPDIATD